MERVKKGERYWFVEVFVFSPFVESCTENNSMQDDNRFDCGNYFHNREEAEAVARRFRAILKGAEVIEMPSDIDEALQFGDTEQEMKGKINEKGKDRINEFAYGWNACRNFMESKIVK